MSKCLMCQEGLQERQYFSEILLLIRKKGSLCPDCLLGFEPISSSICQFCCKKSQKTPCSDCLYWESQGKEVNHQALYHYNDKMMEYFSLYKFHGDYLLRKVFAKEVKLALLSHKGFTIVPIPISDQRQEERGFNQVTAILEAAGLPYLPLLKKEHSQKQSEKKRSERLKTEQIFHLDDHYPVPEKIILVDDIYTTGATIQLAKALLMKKGAKTIKTFSVAR